MFGPDEDLAENRFTRFRRTTSEMQPGAWWKLFAITAAVCGLVVYAAIQGPGRGSGDRAASDDEASRLVLYCAHDLPFVEPLIAAFESETGIDVTLVADTEASKSLGLTRRLEAERDRPQADVFWNNQLLGTVALAELGVFEPYADEVPESGRFPEQSRDRNGCWTAFGGRARVWILNNATNADLAANLLGEAMPIDPDFCMADPLFGTTLTHAAVLWEEQGREAFVEWFESLPRKGVRVVPGNSATRDLVADGVCRFGWTDTDDFFGAVDRGAAVQFEPITTVSGQQIVIPNSVGLVRGCRHREAAIVFLRWLLCERVERLLAEGPAAQIPLGTLVDESPLPERVMQLRAEFDDPVDLRPYVKARAEVFRYLSGRDR